MIRVNYTQPLYSETQQFSFPFLHNGIRQCKMLFNVYFYRLTKFPVRFASSNAHLHNTKRSN